MKYKPYKNGFLGHKKIISNTFVEKPKIKHLSNIESLHELPFYGELNVVKNQMHLKDIQEVIKLK